MIGPLITAGQLKGLVTVQRRSEAPDGLGNVKAGWTALKTGIPARISPMRGGEQVKAKRLASVSDYEIVVRSDAFTRSITTADRILNQRGGQAYDLKHVSNLDEQDRFLTFTVAATR